jgi:Protein of unknown function (DUF5818)
MSAKTAEKEAMKTSHLTRSTLLFVALGLAIALSPGATPAADEVFKGVIADSQCALNVHSLSKSHKEMLQDKTIGGSPSDCVWYCVKERGGRFVLQDKEKVYKLDDQTLTREFAAQRVQVTGTLDAQTNTIHVHRIELVASAEKPAAATK